MPKAFFISGIGTEVGKTVVSAVLAQTLEADYWKPVQSGDLDHTDSMKVRSWVTSPHTFIHRERYRLQAPMSPHASAGLEGRRLAVSDFELPSTNRPLLVEGAGGLMVPLNDKETMLDLIRHLGLPVVLVSRHYLGSINHTLLSLAALRQAGVPIAGLIFNGAANPATESAIENIGRVKALFRLDELPAVNAEEVERAASRYRDRISRLLDENFD